MIWESLALMTLIDLVIVAATAVPLWLLARHWRRLSRIGRPGVALGAAGLLLIALFYLADLVTMWVLPSVMSEASARAAMESLHLEYSWLVILVATVCLVGGAVHSHRDLLTVVDHLERSEERLDRELLEHRTTAAALRESDERYRVFLSNSSDGIWRIELREPLPPDLPLDAQIDWLFEHAYHDECNEAFLTMYGLSSQEEALGQGLDLQLRRDSETHLQSLRTFLGSGYRVENLETDGVTRAGRVHTSQTSVVGVVEDGKLVRAWGIERDITDRKKAERALGEQLRFERLVTDISALLVDVTGPEIDDVVARSLELIVRFLGVDRGVLTEFTERRTLLRSHQFTMQGVKEVGVIATDAWLRDQVLGGELVVFSSRDGLPVEAVETRAHCLREGVAAGAAIPIVVGETLCGALLLASFREREWPDELVPRLRLLAEILGSALLRARVEQALHASEERYRDFVTQSKEGIWRVEVDAPWSVDLPEEEQIENMFAHTYVAECNDALARMYGYDRAEEMLGKRLEEILPRPDPPSHEYLRSFIRVGGRVTDIESKERTRHGEERYFSRSVVVLVSGGQVVRAWGTQRDITDRKLYELRVKEREARLRGLSEAAFEGICITADRRIVDGNRQGATMLGWELEEVIGTDIYDHVAPQSRELVRERNRSRFTGSYEFFALSKDGTEVSVEVRSKRMSLQGREVWVTALRDVSERRAAEERVREYQRQLQRLASELSLAEERERRRIAADLHDHLMQSLGLLRIKLGELKEGVTDATDARHRALVDEICSLAEQAIAETRSLMFDLSPPVLYELGLEAAVEWLAEKVESQQGIHCEVEDDEEEKPLDDEVRVVLFQAVRELLTNVTKHAHARRVGVALRRENGMMRIRLEDDGVGLDRSRLGAKPSDRGGFGLFNIGERLDLLGGHLEIESAPGRGTRVTVTAPLHLEMS